MNETALIDNILRHSLELQRLSQNEEAQADAILRQLEQELRALLNTQDLSSANRREINALIKEANKAIAGKYVNVAGVVDVEGIAQHVAERTVKAMETGFGASMSIPSIATLKSLSADILLYGSPASSWWAKQSEDTAFKFAGIVRRGVLNGETNEQIVRKVVGGRGERGLLGVARHNARALVHTSIMTAANQSRLETYRKNFKFARGVKWLSTLDSHVCWTAETPILMATGEWRPAGDVRVGDWVLGGVTGKPCRVIMADKRLVQSSVVIHKDGERIGAVTHDHPILTPTGWQDAGRVSLSADVSEREVLCRSFQAPYHKVQAAPAECGERLAICPELRVEEARSTEDADYCEGSGLRGGFCNGNGFDRPARYKGAEGLQYDKRGRGYCGPASGNFSGERAASFTALLERPGLSGKDEGRSGYRGGEGCHHSEGLVCDPGGEGFSRSANEQPSMAVGNYGEKQGASERPEISGIKSAPNCTKMERPRTEGEDECRQRSQAGGTTGRSRVESQAGSQGGGDHAQEVERPGVSGEDGRAESPRGVCGIEEDWDREAPCAHDPRETFGGCQEVLGHPESVSKGVITGTRRVGEVEVITLSIEDDPTYIAGGIIVHNCTQCAALDGSQWDFDGKPLNGTKLDFQSPPAHWNCRCVLTPVAASLDALGFEGLDAKLAKAGARASSQGPVASGTTFNEFLKRQTPEFVNEVLGAKRAELYRKGKITLTDLVTRGGTPLTLDQLR